MTPLRKVNLPLFLGGFILLMLAAVMLVPDLFSSVNPYGVSGLKSQIDAAGKYSLSVPPFPPSAENILGTDEVGRDLYSFIIHGTRLTLSLGLLVVLGRFALALPLGVAAGFGSQAAGALIRLFSTVFSAIPALIFSVMILKMNFFLSLDKAKSILAFLVVLSCVGWGKLGLLIMERVKDILARSFIKAEIALGKNRLRLALENVFPHLAAELAVLFFMEMAAALTLLMQLGVFAVFIGNLRLIASTDNGAVIPIKISFEPEWASMLATAKNYFRTAPWVVVWPAAAFFISILGFNLFGEGLNQLLQRRSSKFAVYIRRALSLSRFSAWSKGLKVTRKGIASITALLIVVLLFTGYQVTAGIGEKFNSTQATAVIQQSQFAQVLVGSGEAEKVAEYLAGNLAQWGYKPLAGTGYIHEYATGEIFTLDRGSFSLDFRGGREEFVHGRDFSLANFVACNLEGDLYDARDEDFFARDDYRRFAGKIVLVNGQYYGDKAMEGFAARLMTQSRAKGLLIVRKDELPASVGQALYQGPVLWVTPQTAQRLLEHGDGRVKLSLSIHRLEPKGRNVLALLPGQDPNLSKEAIIIGVGYNFLAGDRMGEQRIGFGLELARKLAQSKEKRSRNIILAFWDGSVTDTYHGLRSYALKPVSPFENALYLDLSSLSVAQFESLQFSADQAPVTRYYAWSFAHQLEKNLKEKGIGLKPYAKARASDDILFYGPKLDELMFYKASTPTVITAAASQAVPGRFNLDDLGQVLVQTIVRNNY